MRPLYEITRRYTREDGSIDEAKVEAAAKRTMRFGPRRFRTMAECLAAHRRAAEFERDDLAAKIARNAAYAAQCERDEARARDIAARMSEARIQFEIERRQFGSFATTVSGSDAERRIYQRAMQIRRETAQADGQPQEVA